MIRYGLQIGHFGLFNNIKIKTYVYKTKEKRNKAKEKLLKNDKNFFWDEFHIFEKVKEEER